MSYIKSDMVESIKVLYPYGTTESEIGIVLMADYTDSKERLIEELWVWQQAGYVYINHYTEDSYNKGFVLCTHPITIDELEVGYWASLAPNTMIELPNGTTATIYHGEVGE